MVDYRKIDSQTIPTTTAIVVALAVVTMARRYVLEMDLDTGTANLFSLIVSGVCVILYLVSMKAFKHVFVPVFKPFVLLLFCFIAKFFAKLKLLLKKNKFISLIIKAYNNVLNEAAVMSKQLTEDIRQSNEKAVVLKKSEKDIRVWKDTHAKIKNESGCEKVDCNENMNLEVDTETNTKLVKHQNTKKISFDDMIILSDEKKEILFTKIEDYIKQGIIGKPIAFMIQVLWQLGYLQKPTSKLHLFNAIRKKFGYYIGSNKSIYAYLDEKKQKHYNVEIELLINYFKLD